jgi:hypothetical protein
MKNEDYLDSDDIEVATLYANIIYQEKGENYIVNLLHNNAKYYYFILKNNKILLQKKYGESLYNQIKIYNNLDKIKPYTRKNITEIFTKMFKNV